MSGPERRLRAPEFAATELSEGETVAIGSLGLVIYIPGSLRDHWPLARAAWTTLVEAMRADLTHYRLWNELAWAKLDDTGWARLDDAFEKPSSDPRWWTLELSSEARLTNRSLGIMDVGDTGGAERASWLRARWPTSASPDVLREVVFRLADILPFLAGTAGYQIDASGGDRGLAFDQIWAWARRYWGVEIVEPQAASWDMPAGLLSVNWLTLVGERFLHARLPDFRKRIEACREIGFHQGRNGSIIQAGATPLCGDINRLDDLRPYRRVAKLLEPALIDEPTELPGMFTDQESTRAWTRRFLHPQEWLEPSGAV